MAARPTKYRKAGRNKAGQAPAKRMTNADCYAEVTAIFQESLRAGVLPWVGKHAVRPHHNALSGHVYQGSNVWTTWAAAQRHGFESTGWVTFNAAAKLVRDTPGARILNPAGHTKSTKILKFRFWDKKTTDPVTGKTTSEMIPLAELEPMFNLDQLSDHPTFEALRAKDRGEIASLRARAGAQDEEFDRLITGCGAAVVYGPLYSEGRYDLPTDVVEMPTLDRFHAFPKFYSTLAHQLVHWTGHQSRLNRPLATGGAFEDMIAEMGSAFLMARMGYEFDGDHARHLASWVQMIDAAGDGAAKLLIDASRYATKAVDLIAPKGALAGDEVTPAAVAMNPAVVGMQAAVADCGVPDACAEEEIDPVALAEMEA